MALPEFTLLILVLQTTSIDAGGALKLAKINQSKAAFRVHKNNRRLGDERAAYEGAENSTRLQPAMGGEQLPSVRVIRSTVLQISEPRAQPAFGSSGGGNGANKRVERETSVEAGDQLEQPSSAPSSSPPPPPYQQSSTNFSSFSGVADGRRRQRLVAAPVAANGTESASARSESYLDEVESEPERDQEVEVEDEEVEGEKHEEGGGHGGGGHKGGHKQKKKKGKKKKKKGKHGHGLYSLMKKMKKHMPAIMKKMHGPSMFMMGMAHANFHNFVMHALMMSKMALTTVVMMIIREMVFGDKDQPVKYYNFGYDHHHHRRRYASPYDYPYDYKRRRKR